MQNTTTTEFTTRYGKEHAEVENRNGKITISRSRKPNYWGTCLIYGNWELRIEGERVEDDGEVRDLATAIDKAKRTLAY